MTMKYNARMVAMDLAVWGSFATLDSRALRCVRALKAVRGKLAEKSFSANGYKSRRMVILGHGLVLQSLTRILRFMASPSIGDFDPAAVWRFGILNLFDAQMPEGPEWWPHRPSL